MENPQPENKHGEASSENPPPKKQKWYLGKRALSDFEKRNAKWAFILAGVGVTTFFLQLLYFSIVFSTGDWLCVLIYWIVFLMPAYAANAGMSMFGGKGPAIDFGHICKDGRRLFGPGKTWRGFILGPIGFGIPLSIFVHWILYVNWGNIIAAANGFLATGSVYTFYEDNPDFLIRDLALYLIGDANAIHPEDANWATFLKLLPRIILCSFGAPTGDLVKSWAKRRKGLERGEPWWMLDQMDFALGALLFAGWWVFPYYNIHIFIMTVMITPTITVVANIFGFWFGKKKVPY